MSWKQEVGIDDFPLVMWFEILIQEDSAAMLYILHHFLSRSGLFFFDVKWWRNMCPHPQPGKTRNMPWSNAGIPDIEPCWEVPRNQQEFNSWWPCQDTWTRICPRADTILATHLHHPPTGFSAEISWSWELIETCSILGMGICKRFHFAQTCFGQGSAASGPLSAMAPPSSSWTPLQRLIS